MPPAVPSYTLRTYHRQAWHSTPSIYSLQPHSRKRLPIPCRTSYQHCPFSTSLRISSSSYRRSDFAGQSFTTSYESKTPTRGPLGSSPPSGVPQINPRGLKKHLDKFVIGQERSKVVLSSALYNHHCLVLRRKRLRDDEEERLLRIERAEQARGDFSEHITANLNSPRGFRLDRNPERFVEKRLNLLPVEEKRPISIQKSNVLMLGPTGVGKTLIVQTLAQVLDVPIATCDCTPLTQAGYIGEDVESSVGRLLAAADYDPSKTEDGIIFFDETDKIATARVAHGKDVSGEGVQQALLKLIEGTTVQVNTKQGRGSNRSSSNSTQSPPNLGPKEESYNISTDNILFIFAGAFVGLDKIVRDRVAKSSIGFGSPLRNTSTTIPSKSEEALVKKSLPYFSSRPNEKHSILDLVDPEDLRRFGFIPEFIGRIPMITALSHLSIDELMRILTDTQDCKTEQYIALFQESGVELRFTNPALQVIAERALEKGTGARGLDSVIRNILTEAMYETPDSSTKFVLVNKAAAKLERAPLYFPRGQSHTFQSMIKQEEEDWEAGKAGKEAGNGEVEVGAFEEYREQARSGM